MTYTALQRGTVFILKCTTQLCFALHCTPLHGIVLYYTALPTALYFATWHSLDALHIVHSVLYCTTLHYTALYSPTWHSLDALHR